MKTSNLRWPLFSFFCFLLISHNGLSQQGTVSIHQDRHIPELLNLKKEMNKSDANRYKIQIYSGNRADAHKAKKEFETEFDTWSTSIEYESPNFKIWAGNFRTRLEADRALKQIKKKFNSAFIFKPKKQKI
ncbi:SPOR domain-containing protein [Snuella sedimenti]|uniref:SPOR domain-containing protein n=1 Tax=Snuella sedimenti TaxID=2798802 RepID=A0A8J7IU18_9FLAO|nr:SPOR domain-containing protein [Snuella sedimenti]MBJ6368030.1 SPOR domain-containing protein [Snuella sedimenti]